MSADNHDRQRVAALLREAEDAASGNETASAEVYARAAALLDDLGMTRAVFDEETSRWCFGHSQAGPAGAATVHFGGGSGFTVDLAEPSRVLALTVSTHDMADARAIVDGLVGAQAAAVVTDGDGASALVPFDRTATPARQALSRLALLDRARDMLEEQHGVWPLWAAEAAVLSSRAAVVVPSLQARAHAEASTAARTVAQVAGMEIAEPVRRRLAELLPELAQLASAEPEHSLLAEAERQLRDGARQDDDGWRERFRHALHAPGPWVAGALRLRWADIPLAPGHQGEPRRARLPIDAAFEEYGLSSRENAVIEYHANSGDLGFSCEATTEADRVGELWLRAYTEGERRLLDSAPLTLETTESSAVATAQLEVPAGMSFTTLGFDLTAAPAEPIEGSRLWHITQAYRDGGSATDAQRAGLAADEADLWRACAEHWAEASEDSHAQQARVAAEQATVRSVAGRDAGEPPAGDPIAPFLAELYPPA
ncbi:MAG: hypothetical protein WKF96_01135 [Solirubrobacteraceae bacterium]